MIHIEFAFMHAWMYTLFIVSSSHTRQKTQEEPLDSISKMGWPRDAERVDAKLGKGRWLQHVATPMGVMGQG